MKLKLPSLVQLSKRCFHSKETLKVGILGVPFDKGQGKKGVADGPSVIRKGGLIERIQEIGSLEIKDYGDISYTIPENLQRETVPNMKEYMHIATCNHELSKRVQQIINDGKLCVTLGGDHSLGIGTVDGHIKAKNENVCVLWVDAHPDLNTNKTSSSGNVHGMPLAILAKELSDYWPYLPGMDWQKPVISLRNIAYIGLRSVDSYERLVIDKLGINAFGMEDIENYGISTVVDMALNKIDPVKDKSIHVSFDIDSLDTLEAPSTGTSVRGGMTLREGIQLMEMIQRTGRLGAMDLVEVNPSIGSEQDVKRTVDAAIHIIAAGLGYSRRGIRPQNTQTLPLQTFPPKIQEI
ncbi:arginase, hepatic [Anthonomus grandis grandis]|uniref:arginase, hepatic n=1 Tax=Anthonomus grandis grandis TaxID=2921223 RepID=UPI002165E595|nr:arginase, hepatic [Anthonomus grandis grandis]